jgi:Chaperone of endosialidase
MRPQFFAVLIVASLIAVKARALSCTATQYPYTLTDGQLADAAQVTADLNCAAVYGLANWTSNVGISTASPAGTLHVAKQSWNGADFVLGDNAYSTSGGLNGIAMSAYPDGNIYIDAKTNSNGLTYFRTGQGAEPGYQRVWLVVQASSGYVGLGTTTPTATLYVNGSTVLTQGYTTTSDARLKTDITPIADALATIEKLQGVRYRWLPADQRPVGKTLDLAVDKPQIGFLAQAVEKVVPEAVTAPKTADDTYTLDQAKLIPLLVEAIKEQENKIAALEAKIVKLEAAR